jgi:hypothetical protein
MAYQAGCLGASKPLKPSPQLSAADKAGIAAAIGIPGLLLIFWFLYRQWKKNRAGEPAFAFPYDNMEDLTEFPGESTPRTKAQTRSHSTPNI